MQNLKLPKRELNLKKVIIIAGPNGAGKTTFARDFLPAEAQTLRFINADLIAVRIPLMADSDSTFIADSIPSDGGHPALVS